VFRNAEFLAGATPSTHIHIRTAVLKTTLVILVANGGCVKLA